MKEKQKHVLVDLDTHTILKVLSAQKGITLGKVIKELVEDIEYD